MAIVDIAEFDLLCRDDNSVQLQAGPVPPRVKQQVSITAGSVQSSAFANNTKFLRVHADAACRVEFGANPTADGTSMRMAAGQTEYFGVTPGHKVAVITTT